MQNEYSNHLQSPQANKYYKLFAKNIVTSILNRILEDLAVVCIGIDEWSQICSRGKLGLTFYGIDHNFDLVHHVYALRDLGKSTILL